MADKVLIHSQGRSVGALKEAIDHYRPSMVFLISNPDTNAGKMKSWIDAGDSRAGNWSKDVEHCEIININPFDEETVSTSDNGSPRSHHQGPSTFKTW